MTNAFPELTLVRLEQNGYATYGHLVDAEQRVVCCTLELPWRNNENGRSCVPAHRYLVEKYNSPAHHGIVPQLVDVPGRTNCQVHSANLPSQLLGCIALGKHFGHVELPSGETGYGVLESRDAFKEFMAAHPEPHFWLTIVDPSPVVPA